MTDFEKYLQEMLENQEKQLTERNKAEVESMKSKYSDFQKNMKEQIKFREEQLKPLKEAYEDAKKPFDFDRSRLDPIEQKILDLDRDFKQKKNEIEQVRQELDTARDAREEARQVYESKKTALDENKKFIERETLLIEGENGLEDKLFRIADDREQYNLDNPDRTEEIGEAERTQTEIRKQIEELSSALKIRYGLENPLETINRMGQENVPELSDADLTKEQIAERKDLLNQLKKTETVNQELSSNLKEWKMDVAMRTKRLNTFNIDSQRLIDRRDEALEKIDAAQKKTPLLEKELQEAEKAYNEATQKYDATESKCGGPLREFIQAEKTYNETLSGLNEQYKIEQDRQREAYDNNLSKAQKTYSDAKADLEDLKADYFVHENEGQLIYGKRYKPVSGDLPEPDVDFRIDPKNAKNASEMGNPIPKNVTEANSRTATNAQPYSVAHKEMTSYSGNPENPSFRTVSKNGQSYVTVQSNHYTLNRELGEPGGRFMLSNASGNFGLGEGAPGMTQVTAADLLGLGFTLNTNVLNTTTGQPNANLTRSLGLKPIKMPGDGSWDAKIQDHFRSLSGNLGRFKNVTSYAIEQLIPDKAAQKKLTERLDTILRENAPKTQLVEELKRFRESFEEALPEVLTGEKVPVAKNVSTMISLVRDGLQKSLHEQRDAMRYDGNYFLMEDFTGEPANMTHTEECMDNIAKSMRAMREHLRSLPKVWLSNSKEFTDVVDFMHAFDEGGMENIQKYFSEDQITRNSQLENVFKEQFRKDTLNSYRGKFNKLNPENQSPYLIRAKAEASSTDPAKINEKAIELFARQEKFNNLDPAVKETYFNKLNRNAPQFKNNLAKLEEAAADLYAKAELENFLNNSMENTNPEIATVRMGLDTTIRKAQKYLDAKISERLPKGKTLKEIRETEKNGTPEEKQEAAGRRKQAMDKILSDPKVAERFFTVKDYVERMKFMRDELKRNVERDRLLDEQNAIKQSEKEYAQHELDDALKNPKSKPKEIQKLRENVEKIQVPNDASDTYDEFYGNRMDRMRSDVKQHNEAVKKRQALNKRIKEQKAREKAAKDLEKKMTEAKKAKEAKEAKETVLKKQAVKIKI